MKNPYEAPKTRILTENEKVIELLVLFQHQMKVINMLRQDGMETDKARRIVSQHVKPAQAILNKKNRLWQIVAWILTITGVGLPILTFLAGSMTIFSIAPFFAGLYCFRRCKKIKF